MVLVTFCLPAHAARMPCGGILLFAGCLFAKQDTSLRDFPTTGPSMEAGLGTDTEVRHERRVLVEKTAALSGTVEPEAAKAGSGAAPRGNGGADVPAEFSVAVAQEPAQSGLAKRSFLDALQERLSKWVDGVRCAVKRGYYWIRQKLSGASSTDEVEIV